MLLIHISDIHFRFPECATELDPERPYRTQLIQDARTQVAAMAPVAMEPVAAILVGGDIAYHGLTPEYSAAFDWLRELAEVCGCRLERVFVVPGNHDVDRNVIRNSAGVRNAQLAIAEPVNKFETLTGVYLL